MHTSTQRRSLPPAKSAPPMKLSWSRCFRLGAGARACLTVRVDECQELFAYVENKPDMDVIWTG